MPDEYKYRGLRPDGATQEGLITALGEAAVLDYLTDQQLTPIEITLQKPDRELSFWGFFKKNQYENLISFTNNLRTLFRAGIPLLRALNAIGAGVDDERFRHAVAQIKLSVQAGKTLSAAMSEFADLFPDIYRVSISAGEESGKLEEILAQLSRVLAQELELTRQIKAGVRYPLMVIVAIIAAFIVLITFVVPRFVDFYAAFNAELPLFTRLLIGTSNAFAHYWYYVLAAVVAVVYGLRKALANPSARAALDRTILRTPILGPIAAKGNIARFAMMFEILLRSGLPMIRSLEILVNSIKNSAVAAELRDLKELLESGRESELLQHKFEFMPSLTVHMLSIGLESGSLENMLQELGDHYSREVKHTTRQLTAVLEPILTIVMGVFVLVLALAIFLPMWNLIQVFRG